jgi:hypothetical protein
MLAQGMRAFAPGEGEAYDDLVARVRTAIPRNIDELKDQARLFQKKLFDYRAKHILFLMYRDEEVLSQSRVKTKGPDWCREVHGLETTKTRAASKILGTLYELDAELLHVN